MKKIRIHNEVLYVLALILMSFSCALVTTSGFGLSMIVSPAFLLSQKFDFLTFGFAEYIVQGLLLIALWIAIRKFRITYLLSFLTCLIYGALLDLWQRIPFFNIDIVPPESLPLYLRIIFFALGTVLTALSVAMFFKVYLYPEVYDLFVKAITETYHLKLSRFKTIYDMSSLLISVVMSILLFGRLEGVGIGTLITAIVNGTIIGFFSKMLDKYFEFPPIFKKLSEKLQ